MTIAHAEKNAPITKSGAEPSVLADLVQHERNLVVARCNTERETQVVREKARLAANACRKKEEERLQKELQELRAAARDSLEREALERAAQNAEHLKRLMQRVRQCAPRVVDEALALILPAPEAKS